MVNGHGVLNHVKSLAPALLAADDQLIRHVMCVYVCDLTFDLIGDEYRCSGSEVY